MNDALNTFVQSMVADSRCSEFSASWTSRMATLRLSRWLTSRSSIAFTWPTGPHYGNGHHAKSTSSVIPLVAALPLYHTSTLRCTARWVTLDAIREQWLRIIQPHSHGTSNNNASAT